MTEFMNGCYTCAHSVGEHTGRGFSCRHTDLKTVTTGDLGTDDGITFTTEERLCGCLAFKP